MIHNAAEKFFLLDPCFIPDAANTKSAQPCNFASLDPQLGINLLLFHFEQGIDIPQLRNKAI